MNLENICMGCMNDKDVNTTCPHCGYVDGTRTDSPSFLPPHTILNGRYIIGKVLGHGGFGITYLAWDKLEDRKTAIKEYFPEWAVTRTQGFPTVTVYSKKNGEFFKEGLDKFLSEAKSLKRFNDYPGIVSVYDFFHANETAYMVMEYLDGETLGDYLEKKGGKIPFKQAVALLADIFEALTEMHKINVLHRDIKPDNIFVLKGGKRTVLIDFGAARQFVGQRSQNLSALVTEGYSPFEQYQEDGEQEVWTDVYALGATLYRMLSGERPPQAITRMAQDKLVPLSDKGVSISKKADTAILKALAIYGKDRFRSIADFRHVLLAVDDEVKVTCPNCKAVNMLAQGQTVKNTLCCKCKNPLVKPFPVKKVLQAAFVVLLVVFIIWGVGHTMSSIGTGTLALADGGTYNGEYWFNKADGKGTLVYADGRKYEGTFKNGTFVKGNVSITEENGSKYEGEYANGKYNGKGILTRSGIFKYTGEFKDGKYYGTGEFNNTDKEIKYTGQFKDGKKNGSGQLIDERNSMVLYSGTWQDDKRQGQGTSIEYYEDNIMKYVGAWDNDMKSGPGEAWVYDNANSEKFHYKGNFKDNKMNDANGEIWFASGNYYKGGIANDKRNGMGTFTWKSGKTRAGNWKDDNPVD